jgi:arylsulfatase A-like enzyme
MQMSLNLIVICLDTFRADLVDPTIEPDSRAAMSGALAHVATPHLDDLARESVSFTQAFGEGQPTLQMRRAFFTGRRSFPWRYNFDRRGHWHHAPGWHKIPPDQDTLAEVLLQRGYFTGLVADTYHMFKPTMNYTRGFATYDFIRGQETDNWRGGTLDSIAEELGTYTRDPLDSPRIARLAQYLFNQRDREQEEDYQCARVFRSAAQWLDHNAAKSPFFLWIDSFDPHEPWDPPGAYADRYYKWTDEPGIEYIYPDNQHATDEEKQRIKALYFGEVTFVDRWVGTLLEKLEDLRLWDDTLVVFTSDHGTQLMDHGSFGKGAAELHPFNTRIPLVIRHPDGPRNTSISPFVQSHDLMPTLLNLLEIPYANVDGYDAWSLVTGERDTLRDHVVSGWAGFTVGNAGGRASVRDDTWNYVVSVGEEDPEPELYNVRLDPDERRNVHDAHPEIVTRQRSRLEAVLGQPLPAQLNEVCDPSSAPLAVYLRSRAGRDQS